jgi:hypothetical protein
MGREIRETGHGALLEFKQSSTEKIYGREGEE